MGHLSPRKIKKCHCQFPSTSQTFSWWSLMLKSVKSHGCVSKSDPQLPPLRIDQQVLKTVRSHKVRGSGGGEVSPRKLVQWTCGYLRRCLTFRPRVQCSVAWYNALPAHLPLVQYASFKDNVPPEALQFARVVRVEDRRSGLCMSTVLSPVIKDHLSIYFICLFNI